MALSPRQTLDGQRVLRIPGRNFIKTMNCDYNIATWNIRTLYEQGKLANACQEMSRLNIHILGLSETRWPGSGTIKSNNKVFYYSGNNDPEHRNGVGVLLNANIDAAVVDFVPLSDRCMLIQIEAKPTNINIIQTYAPTADKPPEELEKWYKDVKQLLKRTRKEEVTFFMGDMNAKVGRGAVNGVTGEHGLGTRNERGDRLIEFCQEWGFTILNTCFKQHPRRLYTWTSPQHNNTNIVRNQIDYVIINRRFRSSISNAKTYPGADIGSDHNPVAVRFRMRLKLIKKRTPDKQQIDIKLLRGDTTKIAVQTELNNKLQQIDRTQINTDNINTTWEKIRNIMIETTEHHLKARKVKKKEWMTTEILELMDERRVFKNVNPTEYKRININIQQKIREAKETWMKEQCEELENLQQKHDNLNLHRKIKELTGINKRTPPYKLSDAKNQPVNSSKEEMVLWENYIKNLFDDSRETPTINNNNEGPTILKSEVEYAIRQLKNNKSPGPDNIYPEIIKLISESNLDLLVKLLNHIYVSANIPNDWLESIFIPIPKKPNPRQCNDFRLISLMSHSLKILLRIIHNRIQNKCEQKISREQFGFRKGMGTREALFSIQVLAQKCIDQQKSLYICFVDFEKAFDKVPHTELISLLNNLEMDERDVRLLKSLYWQQKAIIRTKGNISKQLDIRRGVRQGCILSPILFNVFSENIFEIALKNETHGIKINGETVNNIRYADDTVLIADTDIGLQHIIDQLNNTCKQHGMKINIKKTKTMVISKNQNVTIPFTINGEILEMVNGFKYLGAWIGCDMNPDREIRCRIEMARHGFMRFKQLFCDPKLYLGLRLGLVKCYIWSILLYGAETWTLKVGLMNSLEAFELWCYRRMLRIPWTARISNEEVLRRMGCERQLLLTIKTRKTAYLGHILRHQKYELPQLIIKGKIEGKRGIGRKRLSWMRNIRQWTGLNYEQIIRVAQNRVEFANVIANLH